MIERMDPLGGECSSSSSVSSSIGRNSDYEDDAGEEKSSEVESSYKGPLDFMDELEQVLPARRGISKFYAGRSKSYTSLAEASASSCIKEIVKPENAYSRRRRNLLSHHVWDQKGRSSFPLKKSNGGGISKKTMAWSKSTLALAVAMCSSGSSSSEDSSSGSGSSPTASTSPRLVLLPPLHPQTNDTKGSCCDLTSLPPAPFARGDFYAWRSYSVADLPERFPAVGGGSSSDLVMGRGHSRNS